MGGFQPPFKPPGPLQPNAEIVSAALQIPGPPTTVIRVGFNQNVIGMDTSIAVNLNQGPYFVMDGSPKIPHSQAWVDAWTIDLGYSGSPPSTDAWLYYEPIADPLWRSIDQRLPYAPTVFQFFP